MMRLNLPDYGKEYIRMHTKIGEIATIQVMIGENHG
jgi:hypothetical protein